MLFFAFGGWTLGRPPNAQHAIQARHTFADFGGLSQLIVGSNRREMNFA